jgi:hypothetical protein
MNKGEIIIYQTPSGEMQLDDLKQTIKLLSNVIQNREIALTADEASGLLQVITDYTYALDTLDNTITGSLQSKKPPKSTSFTPLTTMQWQQSRI